MVSGPQPVVAGVPQRSVGLHDGGAALAEDVDLQFIACQCQIGAQHAERDRGPPRGSPRRPRWFRRPPRHHARASTCRARRRARVDGQRHEALLHAALLFRQQSAALPGKSCGLSKPDETVEPAFEQAVIGRQVPLPRAVALFDAAGSSARTCRRVLHRPEHRVVDAGYARHSAWISHPSSPAKDTRARPQGPCDRAGLLAEPRQMQVGVAPILSKRSRA
jgi:hypothetical protein